MELDRVALRRLFSELNLLPTNLEDSDRLRKSTRIIDKVLELQRLLALKIMPYHMKSNAGVFRAVALVELAYKVILQREDLNEGAVLSAFDREAVFAHFGIDTKYSKSFQLNEYIKAMNLYKQILNLEQIGKVWRTTENSSLFSLHRMTLDRLQVYISFDGSIKFRYPNEKDAKSPPPANEFIETEVRAILLIYEGEYFNKALSAAQRQFIKPDDKIFTIAAYLILAETFKVRILSCLTLWSKVTSIYSLSSTKSIWPISQK
jgi:hypothetical protein